MSDTPVKKVKRPKKQKVKQGHKLVWLTLIIILIPVLLVGYELMTSMEGSGKPVVGNRFSSTDLTPSISQGSMSSIQGEIMNIDGVESATINLLSATLRVHLNMQDNLDQDTINYAAELAYSIVNNYLPIDTYFTNTADSKNYDLEIDAYNYIVDDSHPADGQIYLKITKTGAGNKVTDVLTQPKNADLANSVRYNAEPVQEDVTDEGQEENYDETYYDEGYYDESYYEEEWTE